MAAMVVETIGMGAPERSDADDAMRILLLTSARNGLTSRLEVELAERQHVVSVLVIGADLDDATLLRQVEAARPELIVAPTLKRILPESIWAARPCLIVHPGIRGDRGLSSLDWAIQEGADTWGVTLIQAVADVDAGDVWAWREFPIRAASKASLYRQEVSDGAVECVLEAVERAARPGARGAPVSARDAVGRFRPPIRQYDRTIDWATDDTDTVLRKIRAADTSPGLLDHLLGEDVYLFGAHREGELRLGAPGEVFAQRDGAICRATRDGAVWISHLRRRHGARRLKLPAATLLGDRLRWVPEIPGRWWRPAAAPTYREIWYEERGEIGWVHFDCYNGALGVDQCRRLQRALQYARTRATRVIVLAGGADFFSNGIHLSQIEAAPSPAQASWDNIVAIDDVVAELIHTTSHVVVSAIGGDAAAGGAMMALAADRVFARSAVTLNPHYRALELYGSEYWTYLLPRRTGAGPARALIERARPVGSREAVAIGLIDDAWGASVEEFRARIQSESVALARDADRILAAKRERRELDEATRPLVAYRDEELRQMKAIFFDEHAPYHAARRRFLFRDERPVRLAAPTPAPVAPAMPIAPPRRVKTAESF